jgi:hypothetical protein
VLRMTFGGDRPSVPASWQPDRVRGPLGRLRSQCDRR